MTQYGFPFEGQEYSGADWTRYFGALYKNGVFITIGNSLAILQSLTSGMRVRVSDGMALINGYLYYNDETTDLNIPTASTMQDRTDSVNVRLDLGARTFQIVYKQSDVSVIREGNIYEIQLAQILVPMNANTITAANITDMRGNPDLGGYATPALNIDVSTIEAHYTAMLQAILDNANAMADANNQSQQTKLKQMYATFQSWFSSVQDVLTDEQAANLLAMINAITPSHDAGITIVHDFDGYPDVTVRSWEYGLGLVGLGDEPGGEFGGTNVKTYPVQAEYLNGSSLKLRLPDAIQLIAPVVTEQGNGRYLLTEGHRSVGVTVGNTGYKN